MGASLPLFNASGFPKQGIRIPLVDAICGVARTLWPSKTAVNIASRAEISERAAKLWLEGRAEPGADAVVNLLRSDAGFIFLQSVMQGSGTRWWKEFERGVQIAELEQKHRFLVEELEAIKKGMK